MGSYRNLDLASPQRTVLQSESDLRFKDVICAFGRRRNMKLFDLLKYSAIFWSGVLISCASTSKNQGKSLQSSRRIKTLENDLRKKQAALSQLKEQNWILKQKYIAENKVSPQKIPVPFQPSAAQVPSDEATTPDAIATNGGESAEHNLYAKVIASYRQKKPTDLKRVSEILLKTYPQSVFADRAIFLNARLAFENSDDQLALSECDRIIKNYPNAPKLVSTYFLKAQILKKHGRVNEAKSVLTEIQTYFPGSPEAFRTPVELKLLSLQAKAAP